MKIEKVNDNEIKITISIDDLEERNIDFSSLNYNSPAAQELFWDMMEQADSELGFNTSNSQLFVEAIPDSDYGFIISITKVEDSEDFETFQKFITTKLKKNAPKLKRKRPKVQSAVYIYSFIDFEDLCTLSKKIPKIYTGDSSLYKHKDTYYLIFKKSNLTIASTKIFESLLSEYGKRISNAGFYEGYLNEYGTRIIDGNAIKVLNTYF